LKKPPPKLLPHLQHLPKAKARSDSSPKCLKSPLEAGFFHARLFMQAFFSCGPFDAPDNAPP
jgi:hypothetical protein